MEPAKEMEGKVTKEAIKLAIQICFIRGCMRLFWFMYVNRSCGDAPIRKVHAMKILNAGMKKFNRL